MPNDIQKIINGFAVQGFKKKYKYEDISMCKRWYNKKIGYEFLYIFVDKSTGFCSCLKCVSGSLYMGEYKNNRYTFWNINNLFGEIKISYLFWKN